MSIKKKLYTLVCVVGLMMAMAIFCNIGIVDFFVEDVKVIMDDTFSGYRVKEAFSREAQLFEEYMRNETIENEKLYKEACAGTEKALRELPFTYHDIGEERYAITWSIYSSYEQYRLQAKSVIGMEADEENYIEELYTAYDMQEYIGKYMSRLNDAILNGSITYYEERALFLKRIPFLLVSVSVIMFWLLFLVVRVATGSMVNVLSQLIGVSKKIGENDYTAPDIVWEKQDELGQLVNAFNKMKHATRGYIHTLEEMRDMQEKLYQQELEKATLEKRFSLAQLQLLKSQLNPHFLFNTLNMITRMAQLEDAHITEEMLIALSNLLRYSLRTKEPFAPLEQEIKVVEDYMYIQKKRFGERVRWSIECRVDAGKEEIPVFLLQPIVENAVMHGLAAKEEGGFIKIIIDSEGDALHICVTDSGMGMEEERLQEIRNGLKERGSSLGIGLGNIYRRILAYYENGSVQVESTYGEGTTILLVLKTRK